MNKTSKKHSNKCAGGCTLSVDSKRYSDGGHTLSVKSNRKQSKDGYSYTLSMEK
jgi:hypothetical protein